jgi:hypothetical protein
VNLVLRPIPSWLAGFQVELGGNRMLLIRMRSMPSCDFLCSSIGTFVEETMKVVRAWNLIYYWTVALGVYPAGVLQGLNSYRNESNHEGTCGENYGCSRTKPVRGLPVKSNVG